MPNSVRMRSILEIVFAELREKSEQLNLVTRKNFTDIEVSHGITIDYELEKYFIDTLSRIVFFSRHHTYKIPLGGLTEDELSVFFEEVKAFVTAFSTRIPMETLALMDVPVAGTIGQATQSIDLGTWTYIGNGKFRAEIGAMLSQLTQYLPHGDLTWENHSYILDSNGDVRTDTNYNSLGVGEVVQFGDEVVQASSIEERLVELGYVENVPATYFYIHGIPSAEENEERSYLEKSLSQFLKGNYTDDVTLLGTGGQIVAGLIGIDLPMDIRDTVHNFKNWKWTWGHVGKTLLDGIGLIPIIGVIKYADEIGTLLKGAKGSDVVKHTDEVVDVGTEVAENVAKRVELGGIFDDWKKMKDFYKDYEGGVTKFLKANKPLGSPTPKKWFKKGGEVTIDDKTGIWKYKMGDIEVQYIPMDVNGTVQKIVEFPGNVKHPKIPQVKIEGGFTGNRATDKRLALEKLRIKKIPNNYVLHHDIKSGFLQLIKEGVHKEFTHYGGHYYNNL